MRTRIIGLAVCALVLSAGSAGAHGDVVSRSPEEGATAPHIPRRVTVTLTETPVAESSLRVEDGCGRRVSTEVSVDGETIVARVEDAQPGTWRAGWEAISAVDGHPTEGAWRFIVSGSKDCTEEPADDATPTDEASASTSTDESPDAQIDDTPATASEDDDSGFPMVPVAVGAVAILSLAVVARRFGTR